MNYAKSHPDIAILGVNTFRKVFALFILGCYQQEQSLLERTRSQDHGLYSNQRYHCVSL